MELFGKTFKKTDSVWVLDLEAYRVEILEPEDGGSYQGTVLHHYCTDMKVWHPELNYVLAKAEEHLRLRLQEAQRLQQVLNPREPVVHRYHVRHDMSWSVWILDEDTGTLMVFGDRGEWGYTWGHAGRLDENQSDFRREVLRFSPDYIKGKFAQGRPMEIDIEATAQAMREEDSDFDPDFGSDYEVQQFIEENPDFEDCRVMRVCGESDLDALIKEHLPVVKALIKKELGL